MFHFSISPDRPGFGMDRETQFKKKKKNNLGIFLNGWAAQLTRYQVIVVVGEQGWPQGQAGGFYPLGEGLEPSNAF